MSLLASARIETSGAVAQGALRAARGALMGYIKQRMVTAHPQARDEYGGPPGALRYFATINQLDPSAVPRPLLPLSLRVEQPAAGGGERGGLERLDEEWLVSQTFGDAEDVSYASAPRQRTEKITLMPYGAAAALIARRTTAEMEWELAPRLTGRAYATLPLPIATGLPVHLNGRWEIASDRNSLAADDALPRHEWNVRLAGRVCASAYARLLRELAHGCPIGSAGWLTLSTAQRGEVVHALMPSPSLSGVFARAASGARLRGTPTGLNAALASARRATAACNEPRG